MNIYKVWCKKKLKLWNIWQKFHNAFSPKIKTSDAHINKLIQRMIFKNDLFLTIHYWDELNISDQKYIILLNLIYK